MKVSIITVVRNNEGTVKNALETVLSQTHPNIEYIVIDGASTDGTLEIIQLYKDKIATLISEPDKGIYDAMNKGIELASGDIVGILNSDDFYLHNDVISNVCEQFELRPNIDMVFGNVEFIQAPNLSKVVRLYSSFNFSLWKLRFGFMPAHPATFIRKSVYSKYGLYKLGYKIAADYEMFVRLLLVNRLKFFKVNKTFVRMRTGGVSTSNLKSNWTISKEMMKSLHDNDIYSNYIFLILRLPFKYFAKFRKK